MSYDDDLAELKARMRATELAQRGRFAERMEVVRHQSEDGRAGRYSARTHGVVADIAPGMEAWTVEDGRRNHLGEALGGYVLAVDPGWSALDADTGEITTHPARFRCYDPLATPWPYRAIQWFSEDDIDRRSIRPAQANHLVAAVRRFCREVGQSKAQHLDTFEADLILDAGRLVTVIMGGR